MILPKHPLPEKRWRHNDGKPEEGYLHIPYYGEAKDTQLLEMTAGDNFTRKYVRTVANIEDERTSRPIDSLITLDTGSYGYAHDTYPSFFEDLAEFINESDENRAIAVHAWGEDGVKVLSDKKGMVKMMPKRTASDVPASIKNDPKYEKTNWKRWDFPGWWKDEWDWFAAGWHEIARHPKVVRWYTHGILGKARAAVKEASKRGFKKAYSAAALARHANSHGSGGMRRDVRKSIEDVGYPESADEDDVLERLYTEYYHKKYGGKLDRLKRIKKEFGDGPAPKSVSADDLDYSVQPVHVDGSTPAFVSGLGRGEPDPGYNPSGPSGEAIVEDGTGTGGGGGGILLAVGAVGLALYLATRRRKK